MIDNDVLQQYYKYYFSIHKKAKKFPIKHPYHESINEWMIMKRPMMNALKQRWKDFVVWYIESQGYTNLRIMKCEMEFDTYYMTDRRHDVDNSVPKFLVDGLCTSGFLSDDDCKHILSMVLRCHVDRNNPRTEITVKIHELEEKENEEQKNDV